MRTCRPLKFFAGLLILVMLTVTINGVHNSAHGLHGQVTASSVQALPSEISVSQHCPCAPLEQHEEYDCCDTCLNCACHAQLTVQTVQLRYTPTVQKLCLSDPFRYLPEVYLSKFIPPQIQA